MSSTYHSQIFEPNRQCKKYFHFSNNSRILQKALIHQLSLKDFGFLDFSEILGFYVIFTSLFNKDIENIYPEVKDNYHLLGSPFLKKNLGYTQFISINTKHSYQNKNKIIFANMIAQDDFKTSKKRTINYGALAICMYKIKNYILANSDDQTIIEIHTPKFGSGIANWVFIQELIEDIWCKHFLVFIHNTHNSHIKHS